MQKWKLCVEELSSVIAQITQDQRISTISTLLMPVNTYPLHRCWECSAKGCQHCCPTEILGDFLNVIKTLLISQSPHQQCLWDSWLNTAFVNLTSGTFYKSNWMDKSISAMWIADDHVFAIFISFSTSAGPKPYWLVRVCCRFQNMQICPRIKTILCKSV